MKFYELSYTLWIPLYASFPIPNCFFFIDKVKWSIQVHVSGVKILTYTIATCSLSLNSCSNTATLVCSWLSVLLCSCLSESSEPFSRRSLWSSCLANLHSWNRHSNNNTWTLYYNYPINILNSNLKRDFHLISSISVTSESNNKVTRIIKRKWLLTTEVLDYQTNSKFF